VAAEHPTTKGKPPELKPAPKLGQHTDEVMASWLKMSPGDVAKLKSEKIIGNT
jgi:crotonobetainyl-CoA:carnitine CoA-transferase CaiB-like acyl-CoA transferase